MRSFLSKITQLTPVAAGLAAGMIAIGVVAVIGGNYANTVVHNQLAPQQIFFPKPATWPALKPYAGQQVLTGKQAGLYANIQLTNDMKSIAGGKSYAAVSSAWIAGGMKSATLAAERQELFTGTTLRGLLLGAWGWGKIATTRSSRASSRSSSGRSSSSSRSSTTPSTSPPSASARRQPSRSGTPPPRTSEHQSKSKKSARPSRALFVQHGDERRKSQSPEP